MANPYGITQVDIPGVLGNVQAAKSNALNNQFRQAQLGALDANTKRSNALSQALPNALTGDKQALGQVAQIDPEMFMKLDDRQRAHLADQTEKMAAVLYAAKKDPSKYSELRQYVIENLGVPADQIPEQYDETFIDAQANQTIGIGKMLAQNSLSDLPSTVQEWQYYNRLSPEDQKRFLEMKRTQKTYLTNVGGAPTVVTAGTAGQPAAQQPLITPEEQNIADKNKAAAVQTGKNEANMTMEQDKKDQARGSVSQNLADLGKAYLSLDTLGGIANPDKSLLSNLEASASSSAAGQAYGGAIGSEVQSIRQRINNMRPLLVQTIRQATGMSARGMDSNKELEFYMQAATDPKRDLYSNLAAIQVLDQTFGLGNVLQDILDPQIYQRIKSQADQAQAKKPITIKPEAGMTEDGYRFKGGDPADRNNWEKVQ